VPDDPLRFVLKSSDPSASTGAFLLQAETLEQKQEWMARLKALLDQQQDFLRALQRPIEFQKQSDADFSLVVVFNHTL
jgi:hypothetical protein